MFPKHTQLQNSTLSIQIPVSNVSFLARPPSTSGPAEDAASASLDPLRYGAGAWCAGAGIMLGLRPMSAADPARPTAADSRKPDLERSRRYHRKGFTSASVSDSSMVEAQGSFRCGYLIISPDQILDPWREKGEE